MHIKLGRIILLVTAAALSYAATANSDTYGGYSDMPVPGGATGFFRTGKVGDRWVLATPQGNAYWMRAVYDINPTGLQFPGKYSSKSEWGKQAVLRLKEWGFNAIGEYSSSYVLPVPLYGSSYSNPEKLPFIRLIRPASTWGTQNRYGWTDEPFKDIVYGTDPVIYNGWRGGSLPDVFDSRFEQVVRGAALDVRTEKWAPMFPTGLAQEPYLIGTSTDDSDFLYGFKREMAGHVGWLVAVTAPIQSINAKLQVTYSDPTVYSKLAWRDFLKGKYGTLEALNTAWGSSYTTWDSDGGWPNGTGLLDESGRSPWIGRDYRFLVDTAPTTRADLNEFMERFAEKYFELVSRYVREFTPDHLVFGPAMLHDAPVQILRAAAKYIDVLQIQVSPGRLAEFETFIDNVYREFGKPIFLWVTFEAQKDSPWATYTGWQDYDFATQEERGEAYAAYVERALAFRSAVDGSNPIVGIDWWSWTDKASGENQNFGLVSWKGNAYDGREAAITPGIDPWGYATGGELANFGDFLGGATTTHLSIHDVLAIDLLGQPAGDTVPPLVRIKSPRTGDRLCGKKTVSLLSTDDESVARMDLHIDGTPVASFSKQKAKYPWSTRKFSDGLHSLEATAKDTAGNLGRSEAVSVLVDNSKRCRR